MADVKATLQEWSTTASSNLPAGTTSIGSGLDNNLQEIQAVVRQYLATYNGTPIASSGTTAIGGHAGLFIEISGTTTITAFGTPSTGSPWKVVTMQDALTLTHNATSLILPGGANITTAAGDCFLAYHLGSGNWKVPFYQKADGTPPIFINELTAETAPATGDTVAIYDASATDNRKMTLANMLAVVNSLTNDASPVASTDYLLTYDADAGAAKKALLTAFAATTSVAGVSELATAAETLTGTDAARPITPAGFAGNFSGTSAAWTYALPGGIYLNGGGGAYADNGGTGTTYTFYTTFPTGIWGIVSGYTSGNTAHTGTRVASSSTADVRIIINPGSGGSGTVWYLAFGN